MCEQEGTGGEAVWRSGWPLCALLGFCERSALDCNGIRGEQTAFIPLEVAVPCNSCAADHVHVHKNHVRYDNQTAPA